MNWFIRGAFLMALAMAVGWGFMERGSARKWQARAATNLEVANTNARIGRSFKVLLAESEKQNQQLVATHNQEILALAEASERNRAAAERQALALIDKAAVWRDRNANRGPIVRAEQCEGRLENIDKFLSDYIEEVRDVSRP